MKRRSLINFTMTILTTLTMTALPLTASLVSASTQADLTTTTVKTDAATDRVLSGTSSMETANSAPVEADSPDATTEDQASSQSSTSSQSSSETTSQTSRSQTSSATSESTSSDKPEQKTALTKAATVLADETTIPESFGTVTWSLNDAGELHLSGGDFGDSLTPYQNVNMVNQGKSPWSSLSDSITKVVIDGEITATPGASYSALFSKLKSVTAYEGLDNLNMTGVKNITAMFYYNTSLKALSVGSWDVSTITLFSYAFSACTSLQTIDVEKWKFESATDLTYLFDQCSSLNGIDVSNWIFPNVLRITNLFYKCSSLTSIDVSKWNTSHIKSMERVFALSPQLKTIDVSKWNVSNVTEMYALFQGCTGLETLPIDNWDVRKVTRLQQTFGSMGTATLTLNFDKWQTDSLVNVNEAFYNCNVQRLDLQSWNLSKVTSLNGVFAYSKSTEIEISNWDTSNVTTLESLFAYSAVPTVDINTNGSHWNTGKVTSMASTFVRSQIASIDLSGWNTSNVTKMTNMFVGAPIEKLDLSHFNVSKVETTSGMFNSMKELTDLNLDNWDNQATTNWAGMFYSSPSLKHLKLGPKFRFHDTTAGLTAPSKTPPYFGSWCYEDGSDGKYYTSTEMMQNYDGETMPAGDYYWAKHGTVIINYLDSDGQQIAPSKTIYGEVGTAYETQPITVAGYGDTIEEQPENASGTYAKDVINVNYRYTGIVSFATVTPTMNFKTQAITAGESSIPLTSVGSGISVQDTRHSGSEWTVTAKLLDAGFVSGSSGANLGAKLYYQNGTNLTEIGQNAAVPIMTQTSTDRNPVTITGDWLSESAGLKLHVIGHQVRAEQYSGKIEWGLTEGVANK